MSDEDPIAEALKPHLPLMAFGDDGRRVTEWQRPTVNPDGSITVPVVPITDEVAFIGWTLTSERGVIAEGDFAPLDEP